MRLEPHYSSGRLLCVLQHSRNLSKLKFRSHVFECIPDQIVRRSGERKVSASGVLHRFFGMSGERRCACLEQPWWLEMLASGRAVSPPACTGPRTFYSTSAKADSQVGSSASTSDVAGAGGVPAAAVWEVAPPPEVPVNQVCHAALLDCSCQSKFCGCSCD